MHKLSPTLDEIDSLRRTVGLFRLPAYSTAKGALNALNRQVAVDYGKDGIRSNVILRGFVLSGLTAQMIADDPVTGPGVRAMSFTRMGRSEDIAYAALFLCSDEAGFITGIEMPVDGGVLIRPHAPDFQEGLGSHVLSEELNAPPDQDYTGVSEEQSWVQSDVLQARWL